MEKSDCTAVVSEYLKEMKQWEMKWGEVMRERIEELFSEKNNAARKNELEVIFNRFLSKKSISTGQSRLINLSFEDPPEHDAVILREERMGKSKCQIYTGRNINNNETRFDLIFEGESWRLDTKAYEFMNWRTQRTVF